MKFKVTREFYIGENDVEFKDTESGAVAYVSPECDGGKVTAKGFGGKRQKPDFHYRFASTDAALDYIREYFNRQKDIARNKKERAAARKSYVTNLEVGDILESSWGYEQTNVDFYQVVEVKPSGKSIVIRKIASKLIAGEGASSMSGARLPIKDKFIDAPKLKRVSNGDNVRIASYASASPWDGKPCYCSWYH